MDRGYERRSFLRPQGYALLQTRQVPLVPAVLSSLNAHKLPLAPL